MGGQPQVVTLTLDLLLARGIAFDEVVVCHLAAPTERLRAAIARLDGEFEGGRYAGRPCHYRREPPMLAGRPVLDVTSDAEAQAVLALLRRVIGETKQRGRSVHVAVGGGRRSLGILTMAIAPLHFDHLDGLWHLYSPERLRERSRDGALMHLPDGTPPDEWPRLIEIPVMLWGEYLPPLRALTRMDPVTAAPPPLDSEARRRCEAVIAALTPTRRRVLHALASGLTPAEVAARFHLARTTVSSHTHAIYRACRDAWPDAPGRWDYRALALHFGPFFEREGGPFQNSGPLA